MILPKITYRYDSRTIYQNTILQNNKTDIAQPLSNLKEDKFSPHRDSINFCSSVIFENNEFEKKFSRAFFRKIMQEGITCAYTGVPMISRAKIDEFSNMQVFRKKSSIAIQYLKKYKDEMFGIEREVFEILEKESKKHPDLKLQDIIKLKYPVHEKALIRQQSAILDRISLLSRGSRYKSDHEKVRKLINESFDIIFAQDPLPEERFKRKEFIAKLSRLPMSDTIMQEKLIHLAEKLPQSSNSVHAFIVKYAQPYKIK